MSARHTPGPWRAWDRVYNKRTGGLEWNVSADGRHICTLPRANYSEVNSHLIAAAPELLEVLKEMRINLQRIAERVSMRQVSAAMDCIGIAMTETDAAIARAEGSHS